VDVSYGYNRIMNGNEYNIGYGNSDYNLNIGFYIQLCNNSYGWLIWKRGWNEK
jgi:hypothetical protein